MLLLLYHSMHQVEEEEEEEEESIIIQSGRLRQKSAHSTPTRECIQAMHESFHRTPRRTPALETHERTRVRTHANDATSNRRRSIPIRLIHRGIGRRRACS
jgi:hypothetical protein